MLDQLSKDSSFTSERLRYRGIQERDANRIVGWRSNPDNYRFFADPHPITYDEHMEWYARYVNDKTRYDFIIEESDGSPIGIVGLSNIDADSCEVNYIIGCTEVRGRGYAKEAVNRMCQIAFDVLDVGHIEAFVLPGNVASVKVVEANGFKRCGEVFRLRRDTA